MPAKSEKYPKCFQLLLVVCLCSSGLFYWMSYLPVSIAMETLLFKNASSIFFRPRPYPQPLPKTLKEEAAAVENTPVHARPPSFTHGPTTVAVKKTSVHVSAPSLTQRPPVKKASVRVSAPSLIQRPAAVTVKYVSVHGSAQHEDIPEGENISANPSAPHESQHEGNDASVSQAYPRQYHFILNEPDLCQRRRPFLIVMVPVHPGNVRAREVIRRTWGNETLVRGKVVTTLFVLGQAPHSDGHTAVLQDQLVHESATFRDIVQGDFTDCYRNLTIKTMVLMDWLATHCPGASYAMKIDSDMFLNVENLLDVLLRPKTPKTDYITGLLMRNSPVIRDKASKWYVSEDMYPEPLYPPYLIGMGYVFSIDLPEKLARVSKAIRLLYLEDVFVGMCLKSLGIAPRLPPKPNQFRSWPKPGPFDRCDYVGVITTILSDSEQLLQYWRAFKAKGPPC